MATRYAPLVATLGQELFDKVHSSKILLIGAGGIGCELIKNLVLSGFVDIEVVDLDTIDVSNLNRQFLFRPRHVGMPKAVVAREMAMLMNPDATVEAYHANIKEARFGVEYFKKFAVVMNALDNVDARRHVNRLCLASDKVLVEAGTTGFDGQTFVIAKGQTACYECEPKPTQKVYPICTIRSTPDKPVHCVVWAKELFKLLLGVQGDSLLDEPLDGPDQSTYMEHVVAWPCKKGEAASRDKVANYCATVLNALFNAEVSKQLSMDKYKAAKFVPQPVLSASIEQAVEHQLPSGLGASDASAAFTALAKPTPLPPSAAASGAERWDRKVWTPSECLAELCAVTMEVWGDAAKSAEVGSLAFDKDDKLSMRFVAAAANLRGSVFGIASLCFHDVKGVAGNIIPAIATTNAIVAGQQVMELLKILDGLGQPSETKWVAERCKYTYWRRFPTRQGHLLQPTRLDPPNPKCYVCSASTVDVWVDTTTMTFEVFLNKLLKSRLGFNQPTVAYDSGAVWEEGDDCDDFSANLPKLLCELPGGGITDRTLVSIDDFSQDIEVQLCVHHRPDEEFDEDQHPEGFQVGSGMPVAAPASLSAADPPPLASSSSSSSSTSSSSSSSLSAASAEGADDDGDVCLVVDADETATAAAPASGTSRKRSLEEEEPTTVAAAAEDDNGVCLVVDGVEDKGASNTKKLKSE